MHSTRTIFLFEQAKADVIVSHHAPFLESIEAEFQGDALNAFFVKNLDPGRFPETRLWIHGHVHTSLDCLVPAGDHEMRVVCNSPGYPMTRVRRRVRIKVVEIPS
jgi:DNA repair exonuclease SbcCD nuclease subunit